MASIKQKQRAKLKRRAKLLAELEHIVGGNCFNGDTQNWGPHGVYEGTGRHYRYPLTMVDDDGNSFKRKYPAATDVSPSVLSTGHYHFGANRLHVIRALDEVLRYLEEHKGLAV